jgi:hypothetical protein
LVEVYAVNFVSNLFCFLQIKKAQIELHRAELSSRVFMRINYRISTLAAAMLFFAEIISSL